MVLYYGNGGFSFEQLYTMPVYLRNFYVKQLEEVKVKEQDAIESANSTNRKR